MAGMLPPLYMLPDAPFLPLFHISQHEKSPSHKLNQKYKQHANSTRPQSMEFVLNLIIHLFCTGCHLPTPPPVCGTDFLPPLKPFFPLPSFFLCTFLHTSSRSLIHTVNKLNTRSLPGASQSLHFKSTPMERRFCHVTLKKTYTLISYL